MTTPESRYAEEAEYAMEALREVENALRQRAPVEGRRYNYGHVGEMQHTTAALRQIRDRLTGQGEYA